MLMFQVEFDICCILVPMSYILKAGLRLIWDFPPHFGMRSHRVWTVVRDCQFSRWNHVQTSIIAMLKSF